MGTHPLLTCGNWAFQHVDSRWWHVRTAEVEQSVKERKKERGEGGISLAVVWG